MSDTTATGVTGIIDTSKISRDPKLYFAIAFIIGTVTFFISAYILTLKYLGDSDQWHTVNAKFNQVYIYIILAIICLFFALFITFQSFVDKDNALYVLLFIACSALCISYLALSMSVIKSK